MLELQIIEYNKHLYDLALKYFSKDYIQNLKNKSNPKISLVSRYQIYTMIYQKFWTKNFYPTTNLEGIPIFNNSLYWSISHTHDYIFVWISDSPLWIDLETYKERSIELLDTITPNERKIMWEKNFENFYYIWTAKESIIKYNLIKLDNIWEITISSIKNINKEIDNINFDKEMTILYKWRNYEVISWRNLDKFYSICI